VIGALAVPIGLGLGAGVLLGLGFVLQQRMARLLPHNDALSPRLFLDLIGKPLWLAGIAAMVGGQLLGAAALGAGDVSLIEPLLTTNLMFALLFTRLIARRPMGIREYGGALALVAGVVLFLICAQPSEAPDSASAGTGLGSLAFLGAVVLIVATLVMLARSRLGPARASLLGGAGGLLFGMQDGLTRGVVDSLAGGMSQLFTAWPTYTVVVAAVTGILLMQSGFEAAPLRSSLPLITAVEPLTGIGFGIGVYGEQVRISAGWIAGEALGLLVMIVGVVLVARSHTLVTHHQSARPAHSHEGTQPQRGS
jgi:drug/metabolite transporter (DMT)-like permease